MQLNFTVGLHAFGFEGQGSVRDIVQTRYELPCLVALYSRFHSK